MAAVKPNSSVDLVARPELFSQASRVTTSSSLINPITLVDAPKITRPELRIITSLPLKLHQPVPIHHSNLVKSAPLRPPLRPPGPVHQLGAVHKASEDNSNKALLVDVYPPMEISFEGESSHNNDDVPSNDRPGHRRKLSDKFKSVLQHLHVSRPKPSESPIPVSPDPSSSSASSLIDPTPTLMISEPVNENVARKDNTTNSEIISHLAQDHLRIPPKRPHRSPGTASFIVTRQPRYQGSIFRQAHQSNASSSSVSSSTGQRSFSMISEAVNGSDCLIPPELEISHFSDTTTSACPTASTSLSRSFSLSFEHSVCSRLEVVDIRDGSQGMKGNARSCYQCRECARKGKVLQRSFSMPNIQGVDVHQ